MFIRLLLTLLLAATIAPLGWAADVEVDPQQDWYGKSPDKNLMSLAPKSGFVADAEQWKKLWTAWRGAEAVPEIDFARQIVLVGVVDGPNRIMMRPTLQAQEIRFVAAATKMAGPGFAYRLVAVDKGEATAVNGKPIAAAEAAAGSIEVTVIGKLESGLVAIGGETTGTTITAQEITWELDLGDNAKFRQLAEELSGKPAKVEGTLTRRPGIEIADRWIVTVKKLAPAN